MLDEIYPRLFLEVASKSPFSKDAPRLHKGIPRHRTDRLNEEYGTLIAKVYERHPDSDIGLEFGSYLWPQTLCDYSRIITTAPNVKSAFKLIPDLHHIHGASYYPFIKSNKQYFSLALTFPFKETTNEHQRRFCIEAVWSYIANTIKLTTGKHLRPLAVYFDYPKPSYFEKYHELFGTQLHFDAPLNTIHLDNNTLALHLKTHNATLHDMYLKKVQEYWTPSKRMKSDFAHYTITQLLKVHPASFDVSELAYHLNLSTRGLQKKLSKLGLTFSQLANQVRRELTKKYLFLDHYSIDKTSDLLGFQSRSGFTRFFKTEFMMTPAQYMTNMPSFGISTSTL